MGQNNYSDIENNNYLYDHQHHHNFQNNGFGQYHSGNNTMASMRRDDMMVEIENQEETQIESVSSEVRSTFFLECILFLLIFISMMKDETITPNQKAYLVCFLVASSIFSVIKVTAFAFLVKRWGRTHDSVTSWQVLVLLFQALVMFILFIMSHTRLEGA